MPPSRRQIWLSDSIQQEIEEAHVEACTLKAEGNEIEERHELRTAVSYISYRLSSQDERLDGAVLVAKLLKLLDQRLELG